MNRREFAYAAASAALLSTIGATGGAGRVAAQPARFDLVIKGGRVIDPSLKLDAVRDVGIAAGRIAAVEPALPAGAAATLDARGKLVVPGLIDIHTHAGRDRAGPRMLLRDGVTGWIDAGSAGADGVDAVVAVAAGVAATGPRAHQHRPRRNSARRRHQGLATRRRRRSARGDRAASRLRRRHQGAALRDRRRQERRRGLEAHAASRRAARLARHDPHGPERVVAARAAAAI